MPNDNEFIVQQNVVLVVQILACCTYTHNLGTILLLQENVAKTMSNLQFSLTFRRRNLQYGNFCDQGRRHEVGKFEFKMKANLFQEENK